MDGGASFPKPKRVAMQMCMLEVHREMICPTPVKQGAFDVEVVCICILEVIAEGRTKDEGKTFVALFRSRVVWVEGLTCGIHLHTRSMIGSVAGARGGADDTVQGQDLARAASYRT